MLHYLHPHSRTNTFTRTMKIAWQSWASIKNVWVLVLLLELTQKTKHGCSASINFWYTLHSSNKKYEFLLHTLYYYLFLISFPLGSTPLFSHWMRIIVPQYTATFITYGPYHLFKSFHIFRHPQVRCNSIYGI